MTKEELNQVFEWLEENMNQNSLFDLKMTDRKLITAYWRGTQKEFAYFRIDKILEILKKIEK